MAYRPKSLTIIILLFLSLLYSYLLSFGLDTKDSGEFLVCAKRFIPAHSPGSVLYIIIAKLFSFSGPFGVNSLSLIFSVLSVLILMKSVNQKYLIYGLILVIFTFQSVVYYSTTAEIYTMVLFICSLLIYFSKNNSPEAFSMTSGLLGLLSPVYLLLSLPFIIYELKKVFNQKNKLFVFLALFFLPMFLYLFITFRTDSIAKNITFESLIDTFNFMIGKDFQVKQNVLSFDPMWIFNNFKTLFIKLFSTSSIVFILILIMFIKLELKKKIGSLLTIILYVVFFIFLRLEVKNVFHFFIPIIPFVILILDSRVKKRYMSFNRKSLFMIFLVPIFFNLFQLEVNHTQLPEKYAEDVISIVKEPAIVIISIDNRINYFDYIREYTNKIKKDVVFINLTHLNKEYYVKSFSKKLIIPEMIDRNELINLKNLISLNNEKRNIYFDAHPSLYGLDIRVNPCGLVFSTNNRTDDWSKLLGKLSHIFNFKEKSPNDPEFKNLIISYKIALSDIKDNLKEEIVIKEIDRWLDHYQF